MKIQHASSTCSPQSYGRQIRQLKNKLFTDETLIAGEKEFKRAATKGHVI
jgi:hypothetical protein